jgi:hypothetical protein
LAILEGKLSPISIQQIQKELQTTYGNELTVELEETSNSNIHFLDFNIQHSNSKLLVWNFNKNSMTAPSEKKTVRFPEFCSETDRTTLKGIVQGTMKKVWKDANFNAGRIIGTVEAANEFRAKQYPVAWITKSLPRDLPERTDLKHLLQAMWLAT